MSDDFSIEIESALNTTLEGTTGSFKIGGGSTGNSSLEVKYFLTHVGLDFKNSQNNKILSELAPVREIFDTKSLDFDQIMQRDINDARVSSKLIPYILDEKNSAAVKFFPPIVIMALPINPDGSTLEKKYPIVESYISDEKKHGIQNWHITRSGGIGNEVFQFEQPVINGVVSKKNLVRFRIDNKKCKLVIVDGQHRAMALLALYRNKNKEWTDARRQPYEPYYEEWTPDYINQFELEEVELPVIICTVPSLDENYKGDYSLEKAARSIFLTLNKTARPVSGARNLLLDDNDFISYFMRSVLGEIKNSDQRSNDFLRINNIDLDEEKKKSANPIAVTNVKTIYYIIEHIVLSTIDSVRGLSDRKGKFGNRSEFDVGLEKLNGYDELLSEQCDKISRFHFSSDAAETLNKKFLLIYGNYIVDFYRGFSPFRIYCEATTQLKSNIQKSEDTHIGSMIFNGQGEVNVFEEYLKDLGDRKDKQSLKNLPRIEKVLNDLNDTKRRLEARIKELYCIRTELYVDCNKDKSKLKDDKGILDVIHKGVSQLYSNTFSTQAFQTALVCTFLSEIDHAKFRGIEINSKDEIHKEYLDQVNAFFHPRTLPGIRKLFSIFIGKIEFDGNDNLTGALLDSIDNFKSVVSFQEMKPNSWPKYRYIMLEVWVPSNEELNEVVKKSIEICRVDIAQQIYSRALSQHATNKRIDISELTDEDKNTALKNSYFSFNEFLKNFGKSSELTESIFNQYLKK